MQRSGLSSEAPLKTDLEQSKEAIKSEIYKQLKLKEGAENFKKVATDKKTKARCKSILKEANVTIQDLHDGLQDLNARVPEDVLSENDDSLSPDKTSGVSNGSGSSKIEYLKKEMAHEMKFKKGAENLHAAVCSDSQSKKKDSKRTAEVKRPLEDSRRKIEIIRMALLREQRQGTRVGREDDVLMGDSIGKENDGSGSVGLSPLELRVEDVRYHIEIESSVMQGANIMIKSLSESGQDKGLVAAKEVVHESKQILDLLHCSLSRLIGEQFPQQAALGIYKDYNILPSNADRKSEALTGELDVCIIGADRLLVDVPNRDPRKLGLAIVSPDGKIVECTGFNKRKRGCTKWSLDKSLSVEICSVLKLDNIYVGQTSWNALGTECWKEGFHILLDKSRELEVGVYWRDYRSLCGVAFLRLEEFLDNKRHQIQVPLIPQGYLFAEVTFRIPVVRPRPQEQKKPFDIHKGKTFPQTGQMNTKFNVARRAGLQTTTPPPNCTTNNSTLFPKFNIPFPRDRAENFDEQAPLVDCGKVPEDLESSHTSSQVNSDNLMRGKQELSYASVTKTKPIQNCEKENTPPDKRKTKNPMIQEKQNKDDCSTAPSRSCYSDSYSHSSIDQPRASYIRGNSKRKKSLCGPIDSLSEIEIPQTNSIHYAQGSSGEVEDKINQEEPITINSPYSCIGSHQTMPKVERPGVPIDMPADHSNASESFLHSFAGSKKYMPEAGIPVVFAQDNHVCASDGLKHSTTTDDVMEDETNRKNRAESLEARFVEDLCAEREALTEEWSKYYDVLCDGLNDVADSDHPDTVRHITLSGCDSTDNVEEIGESEDLRGVTVSSKYWDILKSILRYIYIFLVLILDFLPRCIWCAGCWSVKSVVHYTALDRLFAVLRRKTSSLFEWIKSFRRSKKKDSTQGQTYNDADTTHKDVMLQNKDNDSYSVLGVPSDARNDDIRKHKEKRKDYDRETAWKRGQEERTATDEIDGRRLLSGKGIEDGHLAQVPSDVVKSLMSDSCSPEEIVVQLKEGLHLGEKCLEQPSPETKRTIRCLAKRAKDSKRIDVVEYLREITPAGTTGPLLPGNLDIRNIPVCQMTELTIDLSSGEEWKNVAEKLGLSQKQIRYLDKRTINPCDEALAFISRRCRITVDDLYDVLTDCGYPVLADTL